MSLGTKNVKPKGKKNKANVIDLSGYAKPDAVRSVFQLLITLFLFVIFWYAMFMSLSYPYWVTMLLAIPTAGFVVKLFIIQHDAGHGSFFKSGKANDRVGSFLGVITLTPYHYWKRTHNIHHATSGNLDKRGYGDIDTLTVDEYRDLTVRKKLFYRIYRNPVAMFIIGPSLHFVLKHRHPWDIPFSWKKEWVSVHFTNAVVIAVVLVAWNTIGMEKFLQVQTPVTLMAASMGAWMFFIQHQFEDSYWERNDKWDFYAAAFKGCSYYKLPGILRWFTGSIGLHHIHHYNSRIPNYRLNECYEKTPAFQEVKEITMLESVSLTRLALWDEESGKLVGFNTQ